MRDIRRPLVLVLQLDPAAEPISGYVHELSGEVRAFDGWIELTAEIERARARAETSEADGAAAA
jgi:hypothetical protein